MIRTNTDTRWRLRSRAAGWAMLILATCLAAPAAAAGGSDDHTHEAPPPAVAMQRTPRIAVQSDLYQVVGILKGDRLTVYVDRTEDNEPVTNAKVTVEGEALPAAPSE